MQERDVVWRPSAALLESSRVARLMKKVGANTPRELHAWSIADLPRFWDTVLDDLGIEWTERYRTTLDLSGGIAWAKWFVGGRINIVDNAIDRHVFVRAVSHLTSIRDPGSRREARVSVPADPDRVALIADNEDGAVRRLTYRELHRAVCQAAGLLRDLGVRPGDRVGIYMPMAADVVIAFF